MIEQLNSQLTHFDAEIVIKQGLTIAKAHDSAQGFLVAKSVLYTLCDLQTIMFLSGGSQKTLYHQLASEGALRVGAVGMIDERYGPPYHPISNELLVKESGLTAFLSQHTIPFYPMLTEGLSRKETAVAYAQTLHQLFDTYPKKIAILGLGVDGHIAGLAPNRDNPLEGEASFTNPLFGQNDILVGQFHDPTPMSEEGNPSPPHGFGQRVTMTFAALSQMDLLLLISFGASKKEAIENMFTKGAEEDLPARFLLRKEIAQKTLFITDQLV